jgi:transposase
MLTLEAWVDIKAMHRQGRSIRSIAKELGISRNTVRRYLRDEKPPHYAARPKRPSILEPALSPNSWDTQREAVRVCSRRNSAGDFIPSAECGATSL